MGRASKDQDRQDLINSTKTCLDLAMCCCPRAAKRTKHTPKRHLLGRAYIHQHSIFLHKPNVIPMSSQYHPNVSWCMANVCCTFGRGCHTSKNCQAIRCINDFRHAVREHEGTKRKLCLSLYQILFDMSWYDNWYVWYELYWVVRYADNGLRCQMCLFHPSHCSLLSHTLAANIILRKDAKTS